MQCSHEARVGGIFSGCGGQTERPERVLTEVSSCLPANNLIRLKMLQSCTAQDRDPRSLSFTTTQQLLARSWLLRADAHRSPGKRVCPGMSPPRHDRLQAPSRGPWYMGGRLPKGGSPFGLEAVSADAYWWRA